MYKGKMYGGGGGGRELKLIVVVDKGCQIIHSQASLCVCVKNVFLLKLLQNPNAFVKPGKI